MSEVASKRRFQGPKKTSGPGRYQLYPPSDPSVEDLCPGRRQEDFPKAKENHRSSLSNGPKKNCEYHKDHARDTGECRVLKAEIKKLVKRGHLREFVKKDQMGSPRKYRELSPRRYANGRRQERGNDASPRVTGRVDTISGGISSGGDTSNTRKSMPEGLFMPWAPLSLPTTKRGSISQKKSSRDWNYLTMTHW
ncbi:hypothetical protein LIER_07433 [Lithospermum erythrorhizon]|uniref:Uncharacterized protein n=1 Tax=Lithospermum erythrorhizon TaxID=34254 RepID=A0AAV3P9P6_LITER